MGTATVEDVIAALRTDFPFYSSECLKIVDKGKQRVPFEMNEAQAALDKKLEEQRNAGRPQRAIVLKARQVGISTYVQGKLIQRATLNENHDAIVVAHDRETGGKLFRMGQFMYGSLPSDDELPLKPPIKYHKRATLLHFANAAADSWQHGDIGLDSTYLVDTAGEEESGRGGTYQSVHGSEVAFWPDIETKLTALLSGVPKSAESLVVLESTANGLNAFKDRWDDAVEGRSAYVPFFWPWWKQREYSSDFANAAEREDFAREVGEGTMGEDEPALLDPGPFDFDTRENVPLTLEQLHWRRQTIANELGGRVDKFKQEYPSIPDEAFLSTGKRVFDPSMTQKVIQRCEHTDPRVPSPEHPGPRKGKFQVAKTTTLAARIGTVDRPDEVIWTPRGDLEVAEAANWKLWVPDDIFDPAGITEGDYVAFCDPSGGKLNDTDEPDYHAIQIIDHRSRKQVATYASRTDPDLLAEELYMALIFFRRPWVGIEVTGGWGLPVARRLWLDYHYEFMYFRQSHDKRQEKQEDRLGWSTDRQTKPIMVAGLAEMLREETDGIRDRTTAQEMQTYVRNDKGQTGAESGKYDDSVESYMGVQQIASEKPLKLGTDKKKNRPKRVAHTYGLPSVR